MSSENLIVSQFNFDQLLISTIDTLKASAIEKCLQPDQALLEIFKELEQFKDRKTSVAKHIKGLKDPISQNQTCVFFVAKSNDSY